LDTLTANYSISFLFVYMTELLTLSQKWHLLATSNIGWHS